MIHYTYSVLKIEAWKILSSGNSLGMGQCAEEKGNGNLFLELDSFSNKILILMKILFRLFHKMDLVGEDKNEDGEKRVTK